MIALNFINKEINALSGDETIHQARQLMHEATLSELPVVKENRYLGMLTEDDLKGKHPEESISIIELKQIEAVDQQCHFFQIWSRSVQAHLNCIPVVDEKNDYIGSISKQTLLQFYKQSFALTEPGCIIILSLRKLDYSLARIANLVEEYDCVILNSFVTDTSDPEIILVTLKLNVMDPREVVSSLQRHEIDIVDVFSEEGFGDIMQERFNQLMSYLNL
jgi:predicted transcriptional regulator